MPQFLKQPVNGYVAAVIFFLGALLVSEVLYVCDCIKRPSDIVLNHSQDIRKAFPATASLPGRLKLVAEEQPQVAMPQTALAPAVMAVFHRVRLRIVDSDGRTIESCVIEPRSTQIIDSQDLAAQKLKFIIDYDNNEPFIQPTAR